jgi:hypothetical protein
MLMRRSVMAYERNAYQMISDRCVLTLKGLEGLEARQAQSSSSTRACSTWRC